MRRIIIEIDDNGKDIRIIKDDMSSIYERAAILSAVLQSSDMKAVGENLKPNAK